MRHQGWYECLIWREEERWLGAADTAQGALAHALRQMFPSTAAWQLYSAAAVASPAATAATESTPPPAPASEPVTSATSATPVTPAPAEVAKPSVDPPRSPVVVTSREETPTSEPERRTYEPPRVGERVPLPTYPAAAVAEAREVLEEILKEIHDFYPDLSLMAPRLQKSHMLGWICRARALDEQFAGEHRITMMTRKVAHELTNISKFMWPGSVLALQMNARPDCVVGELGLTRTLHAPRTWTEASEFVQQNRDRVMQTDYPVDDYGWADNKRTVPGDPRTILREAQYAIEALGGPVSEAPPRHVSLAPEEIPQDTIDALVRHVENLRAIRNNTHHPELWGRVIGRLRWLSQRVGDRATHLRKWLDPDFRPPTTSEPRNPAQDAETLRERNALTSERASLDPQNLGDWLARAFNAFNTPQVAELIGDLAPVVLELDDDALPNADRRLRRRLRDVKSHLRNSGTEASTETSGEASSDDNDDDSVKLDLSEPAEAEPDESLAALVRARVAGKSALFVSNRDDPDLKAKLEEQLGLKIQWCDGNPRKVQAQTESIARASYDLVMIATGFQAHTIDGILARAARLGNVPYVRVFKGRPLACVLALARTFGIHETMQAAS